MKKYKKYYRTYKINDEGEELLADILTEYTDENDIEAEFEGTYQSTEDKEICWTSSIFDKLEATADNSDFKTASPKLKHS